MNDLADIVTNSNILGIGLEYTKTEDGSKKTVYLKVPNPRQELTEALIKEKTNLLINGQGTANPILLTPDGQKFDSSTAIVTAYTETSEKIEFDIGIKK